MLRSNTVQFNGYHGCSKCKIKGVYNHEGHLVVFPFRDLIENKPQLRSHSGTTDDAKAAEISDEMKDGIKGPSWFSCFLYFDLIKGTGIVFAMES